MRLQQLLTVLVLFGIFGFCLISVSVSACQQISDDVQPRAKRSMAESEKFNKAELKKRLTAMQYHVTQEKGTERAFTGKYYKLKESGIYKCIVCGEELFSSETKYDSACGWPAFNDVLQQGKVKLTKDTSHVGANLLLLINNPGLVRTEVSCTRCGAHLGHVFSDGPKPTGKRFCINSAALDFQPVPVDEQSECTNGHAENENHSNINNMNGSR